MCSDAVAHETEEHANTACPVCRGTPCVAPDVCAMVASGVRVKYTAAGRMARFRSRMARRSASLSGSAATGECHGDRGCQ